MSNRLEKTTRYAYDPGSSGSPGSPYVPAKPKRTVWEEKEVCGYVSLNKSGHYETVYDSLSYASYPVWVPDNPALDSQPPLSWVCEVQRVPVTYPATPARAAVPPVPASPSQYVADFALGWNGGARSVASFFEDGVVEFNAPSGAVGIIAGLNINNTAPDGYTGRVIDYGFILAKGSARIIENGVEVPGTSFTYTDTTLFTILRRGGTVTYKVDTLPHYTSTTESGGEAWLEVSLYSGGDYVDNPTVESLSESLSGSASYETPRITVMSGAGAYHVASVLMPRLTVDSSVSTSNVAGADLDLHPMGLVGSDYPYNYGSGTVPRIGVDSYDAVSLPMVAVATLHPASPVLDCAGYTGEVGGADLLVGKLLSKGSEGPYGEAVLALSAPSIESDNYSDRFSLLSFRVRADMPITGASIDGVDVRDGVLVDFALTPDSYDVCSVPVGVAIGFAWSSTTLETVAVVERVFVDTAMSVPGQDMLTWVTNLDTSGSSNYLGYSFNSFAGVDGRYFAAGEGGIYLLDGDTDDGAQIDALIDFGQHDFGTSQKKTPEYCYLGMSNGGAMVATVDADGQSYSYQTERSSGDMGTQRVRMGRGIKANYLGLQIANSGGADFEIDSVEFVITPMKRRI